MSVISTGLHPAFLWPGIRRVFGRSYDEYPPEYSLIFDVKNSDQAFEEDREISGFGYAPAKPEGTAIRYDTELPGPTTRYTHVTYALGYIVTEEELDDNKYAEVSTKRASSLARSFRITKETVAANVLNRAFNSSYTGGDGQPLISTAHTMAGGTWSNQVTVASDLSEAALEDAVTQISAFTDARGLKIRAMPRRLIVAPANRFEAARILNSTNTPGSANNDINVLRQQNAFPGGVVVNHYLNDPDAWFIQTDIPDGLIMFQRKRYVFDQDNDFDTKNARASARERYSVGFTDPRALLGSAGA